MKLKKISKEHYIICDDSEIKEGDWYLCWESKSGVSTDCTIDNTFSHWIVGADNYKKITHSTQPLDKSLFFTDRVWGCKRLSLGEVKELLGEADVEKKALEISPIELDEDEFDVNETHRVTWIDGYNQALEDNKEKKYTEEDLMKFYKYVKTHTVTEALRHIQPKTEWEVEFVDGKLKLKQ